MNECKGIKRKRKSFVQRTMKFYKKGFHGRGVHIDDDTFEYFLHILKVLNQDFESEDDKKAFAENVFEQLNGNEVNYSCNQVVSRIVDNLLPYVSSERISIFMNAFDENIRIICVDSFASFVLQKLISVVTQHFMEERRNNGQEIISAYKPWLLKTLNYVLNNAEEFIFNQYANHILRTSIACIVEETGSNENEHYSVDKDFQEVLKTFVKSNLLQWDRLSELPFKNSSSGVLQVLLQTLTKIDSKLVKSFCRKLLMKCYSIEEIVDSGGKPVFSSSKIPPFFENEPCIRLLEVMLSVASPKIYTQIYRKCFMNRLVALALHREANYAVQKLIINCKERVEFEAIFDELSNSFGDILEQGNSGVILRLCEMCVRLRTKQATFTQMWMHCLQCYEPKDEQLLVAKLTIFMKKRDQYDEEKNPIVLLHGSLLVQNMLKFDKPIKLINSLLSMKSDLLVKIFSSPNGSHIADTFFQSQFVGEKSKDRFIKILQGCYTLLATSKHGSRVFDAVWAHASTKNRYSIASELLDNEATLHASPFGRPIIYTASLAAFRHSRNDWMRAQNDSDKLKRMFVDVI